MTKCDPFKYVHSSAEASVTNHFNSECSLSSRPHFKANRAAALAE